MRSVLIAGKGSFIGKAVERRLADFPEAYAVTVADTMQEHTWKAFDFSGYDAVVHVAGIAHVSPKPEMEPLYFAINRDLAIDTARRAKAAGVGQFLFLSSSIVYGEAARAGHARVIAPDTPVKPANAYGQSKLEAEIGIRAMEDANFRAAILRPMMVFGSGCKGNYTMLAKFVSHFPLFPNFPNQRGTVYIEHLAEWIRLLIDQKAVGTFYPQDAVVSTSAFVREIAAARGKKMVFPRLFNPLIRLLGGSGYVRRAFGGLSYRPDMAELPGSWHRFSFAEAIARTERGEEESVKG